ncbi:MAG: chemotaxis protein CheX [bacterium]|nr:chemotaxis protein CheX [bacterium]
MKAVDSETLQNLTQEVLGNMAFMFIEPAEESGDFGESLAACVEFQSPDGTESLILQGSPAFLTDLASGLLGLEADEVDENVEGLHSLKEIANVLAGELIRELGGEHAQFSLGIPYVLDDSQGGSQSEGVVCDFDAMGTAFRARFVHQPNA